MCVLCVSGVGGCWSTVHAASQRGAEVALCTDVTSPSASPASWLQHAGGSGCRLKEELPGSLIVRDIYSRAL